MGEIAAWFAGRLPDEWFVEAPEVDADRDEIVVFGTIAGVETSEGAGDAEKEEAAGARIERFREETRGRRMKIADEAQRRFQKKVSWGARCGDVEMMFTHLSVPVMTRLRMRERKVLDTLVDAGVARSRSHALAWCVRLVGKNQEEWIGDLRDALVHVERARAQGPATV